MPKKKGPRPAGHLVRTTKHLSKIDRTSRKKTSRMAKKRTVGETVGANPRMHRLLKQAEAGEGYKPKKKKGKR